jgi:hypothetical protein
MERSHLATVVVGSSTETLAASTGAAGHRDKWSQVQKKVAVRYRDKWQQVTVQGKVVARTRYEWLKDTETGGSQMKIQVIVRQDRRQPDTDTGSSQTQK